MPPSAWELPAPSSRCSPRRRVAPGLGIHADATRPRPGFPVSGIRGRRTAPARRQPLAFQPGSSGWPGRPTSTAPPPWSLPASATAGPLTAAQAGPSLAR
jgi:hypothetical protein